MLKLYLTEVPHKKFNDNTFNRNTDKIKFENKFIQDVIYRIDGVKYAGDLRIHSKFSDTTVDIEAMSLS